MHHTEPRNQKIIILIFFPWNLVVYHHHPYIRKLRALGDPIQGSMHPWAKNYQNIHPILDLTSYKPLFVHDGINSVADYNLLRVGVGWMSVVCRMSPCKFHDWIASKRLEILGGNFVWRLILMIYSWNEPIEKIGPFQLPQPPQPPQPPYPLPNMWLANFLSDFDETW